MIQMWFDMLWSLSGTVVESKNLAKRTPARNIWYVLEWNCGWWRAVVEEGVEMSSYQRFLSFASDRERRGNQYLLLSSPMHCNTNTNTNTNTRFLS